MNSVRPFVPGQWDSFAKRIHALLAKDLDPPVMKRQGNGDLYTSPVLKAVLNSLDEDDLAYLFHVARPQAPVDWHFVELIDERLGIATYAAESYEEASATVLQSALHARLKIVEVVAEGSGSRFFGSEASILARVSKITFLEADETVRARVEAAFEQSGAFFPGKVVEELKRIPGLGQIASVTASRVDFDPADEEWCFYPTLKSIANALRRGFARHLGIDVAQSKMLESIAHAVNVKDWNTNVALERKCRHAYVPVEVTIGVEPPQHLFYRDGISGTAALADYCKGREQVLADAEVSGVGELFIRIRGQLPEEGIERGALTTLSLPNLEEEDLIRAKAWLASGYSVSPYFDTLPHHSGTSAGIDSTLGYSASDCLYVGPYVFRKGKRKTQKNEFVFAQLLDSNGEGISESLHGLALYKAELANEEGRWTLREDYGRRPWLVLEGLTDADISKTVAFLGHDLPAQWARLKDKQ